MNSNPPTKIVGIYRYPKSKTLRSWQNQHRRLFACDPGDPFQVYTCLAVWFFTCFLPLIYFALFPAKFLSLGGSVPLLLAFEFLFAAGLLLFLRYCRDRAATEHSEL